jgi:ketosteroid isomerase-like protein
VLRDTCRKVPEKNIEALRWLYEHFARGDFWAAREILDPDIEWEWSASMLDVVGGAQKTYRGIDVVESAMRDWFGAWDWFWVELDELLPPAGDQVVALVRRRGCPKGSRTEVETGAAEVWTMRDGKATRFRAYDDRQAALEAAGVAGGGDQWPV